MSEDLEFKNAFNLTMRWEIGTFFDPKDPETQQGLWATKEQKRKVGYVNHPDDPGGETKFGIAQKRTTIKVTDLTLEKAERHYYVLYWHMLKCDELKAPASYLLFDAAVNHGNKQAVLFLQRACGTKADGVIGPATIKAALKMNQTELCNKMLNEREAFYRMLAVERPKLHKFLFGWLSRNNSFREVVKKYIV